VLLLGVASLSALLALTVGGGFLLSELLGNQVQRYPDVFERLEETTRPPAPPAGTAKTFLFVGVDTRAPRPTTGTEANSGGFVPGAARSDVIMLVRVNSAGSGGTVVSLPRDSWVRVPGHGMTKINAAYSLGGPTLLIQTIESLTQVRIDHFGVVDFAGFQAMTDAVGGIDVNVAAATTVGTTAGPVSFHAGLNHLDGKSALAYVRQRYGLPRGDLDRVQRQQNALRALLTNAASGDNLSSPARVYGLLDTITRWVGLDDTLTNGGLRTLALEMRNLSPANVTFMTAPVRGTGSEGAQSVVYLDDDRASELWPAFNSDSIDTYLQRHPSDVLGDNPR
jgi:LCP family protein required for cell wall assembly